MSRKRTRKKEQRALDAGRSSASPAAQPSQLSLRRKWLFRLLAVFVVPLIFLGGAELCLRLLGFGFDPHFFKQEQINGKDCYAANEDFGRRYFPRGMVRFPPPVVMPRTKAPDTFRIFIFGESAALGDPRPNYGAGNYLEVLLSERFPQAEFEVINTSITAINSHVILPIARECASYAGDLWIIYMGNNEMVGPFGAATVFGARAPPLWWVRLQLQLRQLRLGQLLLDLAEAIQPAKPIGGRWQGMEMFVHNQISPGDPSRQRAYRNFERNLEDVLKSGRASGAKIVLSTVAVNLKDCPPFGSDPSPTNNAAYEKLRRDGETAFTQGRFAEASSSFQRATELCPQSAEARFQLAMCLLRLTNAPAARPHFVQAMDDDALPFRADSRINDTIRAAARRFAGESVILCDAAEALSAASPHGIPGDELFYEHVHLNPDGNYALAIAWAGQIEKLLGSALKRDERAAWASQAECEQWLGFTDWNRVSILDDILLRIQRPPFSGQSGQVERAARLQTMITELRHHLTDEAAAAPARDVYDRALRRAPEDFRLHANYAEFLEARREWTPAIAERRKVLALVPKSYFPCYTLGVDLKEAGELAEAHEVLLRANALKPNDGDVLLELGTVSARQGQWERARQELEASRRFSPDDPRAALFIGEVLWKLEQRNEALAALRDAIRLAPSDWQPHYRLANDLARLGNLPDAAAEYQEALRLNPANVKARFALAEVLVNLGRGADALRQLDEILMQEPANQQAFELRRKLRGQ